MSMYDVIIELRDIKHPRMWWLIWYLKKYEEEGEASTRKTTDKGSAQPEQEPCRSLAENEARVS